jgi:hypothetical protein
LRRHITFRQPTFFIKSIIKDLVVDEVALRKMFLEKKGEPFLSKLLGLYNFEISGLPKLHQVTKAFGLGY